MLSSTLPPRTHYGRPTSRLRRFAGLWRSVHEELRAALYAHLAEPYLRLAYPTDELFASAFKLVPGTAAFVAAWARELAQRRESQRNIYQDDDWVTILYAEALDGELVVVGTILTVRGTRPVTIAEAIGDPKSSVSTLRMLEFSCGPLCGLDASAIRECDVAELARLCIRQAPELAALACAGTLTLADAAYVEAHAFDELFARAYWRDQAWPDPPQWYFGNTRPWLMSALERRELDVRRLYLDSGAAPTARVLTPGSPPAAFFGRWREILALHVDEAILAQGTRAAIAHLVATGFAEWDRLELSLPYALVNNARTKAAMAALAQSCGFTAEVPELELA